MDKLKKRIIDATVDEFKEEILKDLRSEIKKLVKEIKPKPAIRWISRREAKERLEKSYVTLNVWNKKGILKAHKIGGSVKYKESDIDEKLNSN